jgi:hypothetical protein
MSDPSIQQLEREVEAARARLAGDLAILRAPGTYEAFTAELRDEAVDLKDAVIDKAKSSVQSTFDKLIEDVKARAAANPAAALAIGAGIAWRLIRHPPIATALVGAGLYSLFKTSPAQINPSGDYLTQARTRLGEQASELAGTVKDRAAEIGEVAVAKAAGLASETAERASAIGESAKDKVEEIAGSVTQTARQWSAEARDSARQTGAEVRAGIDGAGTAIDDMRRSAADAAQRTAVRAGAVAEDWVRPAQQMIEDPQARDKLLLGAAGIAVVAALGIACQRRLSEPAEAE